MIPKEYDVLRRAVEDGLRYGLHRCFKYDSSPIDHDTAESRCHATLTDAVLAEISAWFTFPAADDDA